ncbi:MAG: OmpH family outer membrane protein [Phycisphaerales bacterium]
MTVSRTALTVLVASAALAAAALTTVAVPLAKGPPAPVVATLNLETLIGALTEKNVREGELKGFAEGLQGELTTLGNEISELNTKMPAMSVEERKAAAPKVLEKQFNAKVKKELYEALIDQRRGEIFKGLYEKITASAKRLADRNGYTVVFASDEAVKVPNGPSNEIERTITLKRFIYVAKEHDVTQELIAMMNNEWAAGGSAGAPSGK